jgi:hypothetical protein
MTMLWALIAKDLRRALRNPLPYLLNLALPLSITALVGMVFGGGGEGNRLGRIHFAVVDQDDSTLSRLLRGAVNQDKAAQYFDPVFLDRDEAMRQLNDNKLSAMLVIPENFTSNYLTGRNVELELVKNPAEQIHPAVLEELMDVLVTAMNAVSHNFLSEFPQWRRVANGDANYHEIAQLIDSSGGKIQAVRKFVLTPMVGFTSKDTNAAAKTSTEKSNDKSAEKPGPKFNLFGYLLSGMTAMFLLFLAGQGTSDLHHEIFRRTFERYHTMRERMLPFVGGKAVFTIVVVSIGALILLGGGGLIFHIKWQHPFAMALLTLAYICFATGLMSVQVALAPNQRVADALNNMTSMLFSTAGGVMVPPEQLPAFLRFHITPHLPTYWYATSMRQMGEGGTSWEWTAAKLILLAAIGLALAGFLFRRRFKEGIRA